MTDQQLVALKKVYERDTSVAPSLGVFIDQAKPALGLSCIMVEWKGMWLGIEEDGYTHS